MAFHDVRLPDDVERGARGGPRFKNQVMALASGHEKINIEWEKARGQWDVSYGIQREADLFRVINFFYARFGRAHSFRFKDWSDYKLTAEVVGIGDGVLAVFQTVKTYSSGGYGYVRTITKVTGTPVVALDGVPQLTGVTLDLATGLITFDAPVAMGVAVTVTGEFDCHVRFDSDALDVSAESFESGEVPAIPLIEKKA